MGGVCVRESVSAYVHLHDVGCFMRALCSI